MLMKYMMINTKKKNILPSIRLLTNARDRGKHRETDSRIHRQTDRQAGRQTARQAGRQAGRHTNRQRGSDA